MMSVLHEAGILLDFKDLKGKLEWEGEISHLPVDGNNMLPLCISLSFLIHPIFNQS